MGCGLFVLFLFTARRVLGRRREAVWGMASRSAAERRRFVCLEPGDPHVWLPTQPNPTPPAPAPLLPSFAQGVDLTDEELIDHISQTCVMSKSLDDYDGARGRGGCG